MHKRGFTLIELLAVVLIVGVLTTVALPQYRRSLERSRVAEAAQMLPAIFDARERLMIEKNISWDVPVAPFPADQAVLTFANLDIAFKGSGDGKVRTTDSFQYNLFDAPYPGTGYSSFEKTFVSAKLTRGRYANTMFYYDGATLTCCNANLEICDFFNLPQNSSTCPLAQVNPTNDD